MTFILSIQASPKKDDYENVHLYVIDVELTRERKDRLYQSIMNDLNDKHLSPPLTWVDTGDLFQFTYDEFEAILSNNIYYLGTKTNDDSYLYPVAVRTEIIRSWTHLSLL